MTNTETAYHPQVTQRSPLLSQAILAGASPQPRNTVTNGGNLLQRTRYYYFYDAALPCNTRQPGTGCPARDGCNRIHAILGASDQCIATHPSDMCVALAALGAVVHVAGSSGARAIPFAELHRLPGDTPHIDTNLQLNEIITAIDLPARGFPDHSVYLKVRDRSRTPLPSSPSRRPSNWRVSTLPRRGSPLVVAHKPWRNPDVEARLRGTRATRDTFQSVATNLPPCLFLGRVIHVQLNRHFFRHPACSATADPRPQQPARLVQRAAQIQLIT